MNLLKKILLTFVLSNLGFINFLNAKPIPDSFADLAQRLMPSVVNISTTQTIKTKPNQLPFRFPPGSPFEEMFKDFNQPTERKASSLGSGFIIDKNGTIITNNHVINNAEDIIVKVGKKEYKAKVLGADPYSDLAVLKIDAKEKFIPVKFGNSDKARVGEWVVAIGNPFGLGGTVTSGIISARNRDINLTRYDDFIQTDASINPGNSGGALVNLNGELVGINTAIMAPAGGNIGIGFAIPSNMADSSIDQILEHGEVKRGQLGVIIQDLSRELAEAFDIDKQQRGVVIAGVQPGSAAESAGLEAGDIVISIDGEPVESSAQLRNEIGQRRIGQKLRITILRDGKTKVVQAKVGEAVTQLASNGSVHPFLEGASLESFSDGGVEITAIERDSTAAESGLRPGDVILSANRYKVGDLDDLRKILKQPSQRVVLRVKRGNAALYLVLQ